MREHRHFAQVNPALLNAVQNGDHRVIGRGRGFLDADRTAGFIHDADVGKRPAYVHGYSGILHVYILQKTIGHWAGAS